MPVSRSHESATTVFLQIVIVSLAYIVAARIGLSVDAVGGFATVVWPASGIALAALLLGGFRLWPAIAIGAFTANYLSGAPVLAAVGIAIGNTMEALVGTYLLQKVPDFRRELDRVRDVLAFMFLAAALSTLIAATIGVTTLLAFDLIPPAGYGETWLAWWLGDAIGIILVAPLILAWLEWKPRIRIARISESLGLASVIALTSFVVFGAEPGHEGVARAREYMLFPPLVWAALRFGPRGAVTSTAFTTAIAIVYTAMGQGPFARGDLHDSLLSLQLFAGIAGATFLVLGASMAERRRTARDLDTARELAESANKAKSGFLAVVSHELRTPLNAIMGYVDLLLLEIAGPLTVNQRGILERIRQSQRHLLSLIEDMLGFAQVEAGRLSFVLQDVNVRHSIEAVEHIVNPETSKKALTLRVSEIDPSLFVHADPDRLRQILLNLVTNAVKFTEPGGIIQIDAERVGNSVTIKVADTGIGISEQNLAHVFDPFFQVDQGGTRKHPGVGLGLSIVRDIVLAMNGDVAIESTAGKGTIVSISLPVAGSAMRKQEASDSSMASSARAALRS